MPPTFTIDYGNHYSPGGSYNGLASAYDVVEDHRGGGTAFLSRDISAPNDDTVNVQKGDGGGCPAKSSNTLIEFDKRVGNLPQEAMFQYDVKFDQSFTLRGDDTYRFYWTMNRYSGNQYDSTNGNGFSNAIGVTSRYNPPSGSYTWFSYTYDMRGASNFQPMTSTYIPVGEWFTLTGYVRCNDPGRRNAVSRFWKDDQLLQEISGYGVAADVNGFCHQFGPSGYYTYCNATNSNRPVYFSNPRYWVDNDIPDSVRSGDAPPIGNGGGTDPSVPDPACVRDIV